MKWSLSILVMILAFFLFTCSKIENGKDYLVQKTKDKISKTSKKVWKKGVEKTFEYSTIIKPCQFEDVYGKNTGLKINNFNGKRIEYIGNFYQCFIIYQANINKTLSFLTNLKTVHPEISDNTYAITDRKIIYEKLSFVKSKFPNIYNEIEFFLNFEKENDVEYYKINKYPFSNIIIYDKKNNLIYHFVENYQD